MIRHSPLATRSPSPCLPWKGLPISPFSSLPDFCHRTRLSPQIITNLIRTGACDEWGDRRTLLWQLGALDYRPATLDLPDLPSPSPLSPLTLAEESLWEYELLGYAPSGHLLRHYRPALRQAGLLSIWQVKEQKAGQRLRVAGLVTIRQRPPTANGILFLSLEDESGLLDVVISPDLYDRSRDTLRTHPLLLITGILQRNGPAVSLRATTIAPFEACTTNR